MVGVEARRDEVERAVDDQHRRSCAGRALARTGEPRAQLVADKARGRADRVHRCALAAQRGHQARERGCHRAQVTLPPRRQRRPAELAQAGQRREHAASPLPREPLGGELGHGQRGQLRLEQREGAHPRRQQETRATDRGELRRQLGQPNAHRDGRPTTVLLSHAARHRHVERPSRRGLATGLAAWLHVTGRSSLLVEADDLPDARRRGLHRRREQIRGWQRHASRRLRAEAVAKA